MGKKHTKYLKLYWNISITMTMVSFAKDKEKKSYVYKAWIFEKAIAFFYVLSKFIVSSVNGIYIFKSK